MVLSALINHILFAGTLFLVAVLLTRLMLRAGIFDVPNHRSSHDQPVASSGGVAIVLTVFIGFATVYLVGDDVQISKWHMSGLALGAIGIVLVSFLDDLGFLKSFRIKLATQFLAGCILLIFDIVISEVTLPFVGVIDLGIWGYPVTLIWVIGLTNIFNFMDGLNGLAGGTGALVAALFGLITFLYGSLSLYILCYVIFAALMGFLVFNFPKARIFMGDVGSQFLGFLFATLAVIAAEGDVAPISLLIMPVLFFHFIFDTFFTFARRLLAGEDVTQAHRAHLYQLLNRLDWSHVQVSLLHFGMTLIQGLGVVWLLNIDTSERGLVLIPFVLIETLYAFFVIRAARRRELL
jgi:UDP-GlcNAc:undecaprenyl-phosphate GlcNAc-1-phosphate transferase